MFNICKFVSILITLDVLIIKLDVSALSVVVDIIKSSTLIIASFALFFALFAIVIAPLRVPPVIIQIIPPTPTVLTICSSNAVIETVCNPTTSPVFAIYNSWTFNGTYTPDVNLKGNNDAGYPILFLNSSSILPV